MRDTIGRILLGGLGAAAIVAGLLGLLGFRHLETRTETVIVAIGAILNGAATVWFACTGAKRAA